MIHSAGWIKNKTRANQCKKPLERIKSPTVIKKKRGVVEKRNEKKHTYRPLITLIDTPFVGLISSVCFRFNFRPRPVPLFAFGSGAARTQHRGTDGDRIVLFWLSAPLGVSSWAAPDRNDWNKSMFDCLAAVCFAGLEWPTLFWTAKDSASIIPHELK